MLFLEPSTIMDICILLMGVVSILIANPKPKPFVFTTLDWQILVGLVLAVLILVVILYWLLLKCDNRLGLIKRLFYASILGNALFEAALAIGKNVLHSTLDSKTSFIAFSIMLALIILTLMLKEFYRVQKYHQVQIYGICLIMHVTLC